MAHQWHLPPPPQYGPPFQYQPQMQNASQQQQILYGSAASSPSVRQQYAYPPPTNQARFDANNQIPSPNSVPPQYSSAGFNPILFHQFASSSLPPPPPPSFPPLPLHNANFSPFIQPPQMPSNGTHNPYSPNGQPTQQNLQRRIYNGPEQPNTGNRGLPNTGHGQAMNTSEGRLGSVAKSGITMPENLLQQNSREISRGTLIRQNSDIGATASSEGGDSVSSYNPPSATPPESCPTGNTRNQEPQSVHADESSNYKGRGPFEMRELAKGALLSLAPYNIKFSDLLAEGIDAQLLSQLFEEVGLPQTPDLGPKATTMNDSPTEPSKIAQAPTRPTPATSLARHSSGDQLVVKDVMALPSAGGSEPNGTLTSSVLVSTKVAEIQSSISPAMERKDRIAALLAAKTGKPIPRKDSPVTVTPSLAASVPAASSTVVTDFLPAKSQTFNPSPIPGAVQPTLKTTPKPKTKAQTELVRQKMEQLKRETLAKAQAQEAPRMPGTSESLFGSGPVDILSTYPQASLPLKPGLEQAAQDNVQTDRMSARSAPPLTAASIPGLFMMDAEPDPLPWGTHNDIGRVNPTTSSDSSRGMQPQHPTAHDMSTLSRESSSSRAPTKRKLAAEACNEEDELPPAKKQNSRPSSSHGQELPANDNDSDDFSEGEIMEIEEGSPVSPLPKTSGPRRWSPDKPGDTTWPQLNNHVSLPIQQQGVTVSSRYMDQQEPKETESQPQLLQNETSLESSIPPPKFAGQLSRFLSPASLSATNSIPLPTSRQQPSQGPVASEAIEHGPVSTQPNPAPPTAIDRVQREKELREKLLRDRLQRKNMLKEGLPELDKEVQKTQNRQTEVQARLAQLRREAEKREEEAREARRREQEIMEEVRRLEQQIEMGINGQHQFSQEMETLDRDMTAPIPAKVQADIELEPTRNHVQPIAAVPLPMSHVNEDKTIHTVNPAEEYDEQPANDDRLDSGDSVSESEDEALREEHNSRHVRPSAEAALPTAEEEAAFLEPAAMDKSVSEEEFTSQDMDKSHLEADVSDGRGSNRESDDSPMAVDCDSNASVSMSDSGSEDYEPAEPIVSNSAMLPTDEEDDEYDPMDALISGSQSVLSEEDQEDYEPSEVVEPVEIRAPSAAAVIEQTGSPISNAAASENEPEHGDDREHGLELTEANTLTYPQEVLPSVADAADANSVRTIPLPSDCLTSSRPLVHLNVPPLPVLPPTKVL